MSKAQLILACEFIQYLLPISTRLLMSIGLDVHWQGDLPPGITLFSVATTFLGVLGSNQLLLDLVPRLNIVLWLLLLLNSCGLIIYYVISTFLYLSLDNSFVTISVLFTLLWIRSLALSIFNWIIILLEKRLLKATLITSFILSSEQLVDIFTKSLLRASFF